MILALPGCENADPDLFRPVTGPGATGPASLALDIQPTFTASCAISGCHAGPSPAAGLSLEAGRLYTAPFGAVGVPSIEAPLLLRIEPGRSDRSYLVDKLEGSQLQAGGSGEQMPLGLPELDAVFIGQLRSWIDDGALDN